MKNSRINHFEELFICVALLFLLFHIGKATTIEITDDIDSDTTWTADTVLIMNDISVLSSRTLTINPGTFIEFQGHYKLAVDGRILAIGKPDSIITFTVNDTTLLHDLDTTIGGWNGIDFTATFGDTSRLEYCLFEYGKATDGLETWNNLEDNGGGILCNYNSVPLLIRSCTIQNSVAVVGGAIKVHQGQIILQNSIIKHNIAYSTAGLSIGYSDGLINANVFTNNVCDLGGTIYLENTDGLVTNNIIVNNESTVMSGSVYVNSANTSKRFSFYNNIIANNLARVGECAGIVVSSPNSHPYYKNNIIWNNIAQSQNYQIVPDTIRCVEYNLIQGGYSGIGNIDEDPLFLNPSAGAGVQYDGLSADWSIYPYSPCANAGKPDFTFDSIGVEFDFAGNSRIQFDTIDIGAFELQGLCNVNIVTDPDNIIVNGDFGTCELEPWYMHTDEGISEPANYIIYNEGIRIMPRALSSDPQVWEIQLLQTFTAPQLEMMYVDSTYQLTFDASADANNRPCRIVFYLAEEPWTPYHSEDIYLGTDNETYTYEFTVSEIFPSLDFSLSLGNDLSAATFDNIRLVKVPAEPQVNTIKHTANNNYTIFPNPANAYLHVLSENGSIVNLYNQVGILIVSTVSKSEETIFNINDFPAGIYYLEIRDKKISSIHKVIIQ